MLSWQIEFKEKPKIFQQLHVLESPSVQYIFLYWKFAVKIKSLCVMSKSRKEELIWPDLSHSVILMGRFPQVSLRFRSIPASPWWHTARGRRIHLFSMRMRQELQVTRPCLELSLQNPKDEFGYPVVPFTINLQRTEMVCIGLCWTCLVESRQFPLNQFLLAGLYLVYDSQNKKGTSALTPCLRVSTLLPRTFPSWDKSFRFFADLQGCPV